MQYAIELPDEVAERPAEMAAASGEDVSRLIEAALLRFCAANGTEPPARRRPDPPLDAVEICAPVDLPRGLRWGQYKVELR